MQDRLRGKWLWKVAAFASLLGCDALGCGRDGERIAEVVETQGATQFDIFEAVGRWEELEEGHTSMVGDGLRTQNDGELTARLVDGSLLRLEPNTQIRFRSELNAKTGETKIDVSTGEASLLAGSNDLRLRMDMGLAIIESGSKLKVSVGQNDAMVLDVTTGQAVFESANGSRELGSGDSLEVTVGGVILEEEPEPEPEPEPLKSLSAEIRGVVRAKAPGETRYKRLRRGTSTLEPGTTLRLASRAEVVVAANGQKATLRGKGTYTVGGKAGFVETRSGRLVLESTGRDSKASVPGGVVVARARDGATSRASIAASKFSASVQAKSGVNDLISSKASERLRVGESARLGRDGSITIGGRGPGYSVFTARTGESFTVRDPSPPTAVGFRTGKTCPEGAVGELERGSRTTTIASVPGQAKLNFLLSSGSYRYKVRCLVNESPSDTVAASGSIRVMRDSGRAPLPRLAPSTLVDTDGRKYTVMYQNLLPALTVRWKNAPSSSQYILQVKSSDGKTKSIKTSKPKYELRAGTLREGTHALRFKTGSGGKSSRESTLVIRFDNASPKASVNSPENKSFAPGSQVVVSGVALKDWRVSVLGSSIPLDRHHRFKSSVTAPESERGLAIRLAHPRRGVHYYVRRATSR